MEHGILRNVIVYLVAAVVCVPLASRFKLGAVLGYLAAGCVIGPHALRLVNDPTATLHFAEIGVVLMLFVIGLELDPQRLWGMRRQVFGGGALQLGACGAALALTLLAFGLPWKAAVIAGLALGLSSTAVAVQSMQERGLSGTPMGQRAFGILLFQDIAAIPLVGIVPLLSQAAPGAHGGSSWVGALRVLGAIVAVVFIGRYVTRPALRIAASTGLREVFTAFALLLVLGIAQLMNMAGVSMALGAFLAGVLLASSEYRHALETDIEPFKGLLMGLFFIAVGMSIDFGLLARRPFFVLGLLLAFQVMKLAALRAIAPRLGVTPLHRWLFAAVLAQGGEFAFVVFGVARGARLLPGDWDAMLTLAVALSMALTPLMLILHEKIGPKSKGDARPDDAIDAQDAPVIIAGFGRFGQIVGRLLFASGLRATVLDHDPDQIDLLRRFGFRIYYGDARRTDLLHAAGAGRAKVIVVAVDDVTTSLELVDAVRAHFPHLAVLARARNVSHVYELRKRGVKVVERETFEAALTLGRRTLEHLGVAPYETHERSDRFRRHNVALLNTLVENWDDEATRVSLAQAGREQLEQQFEQDRKALERQHGHAHGWRDADEMDDPGDMGVGEKRAETRDADT